MLIHKKKFFIFFLFNLIFSERSKTRKVPERSATFVFGSFECPELYLKLSYNKFFYKRILFQINRDTFPSAITTVLITVLIEYITHITYRKRSINVGFYTLTSNICMNIHAL